MEYTPRTDTKVILDAGMEFIRSLPYTTTSRAVFYRLKEDGLIAEKAGYNSWLKITSSARKALYVSPAGVWCPDIFADDGREVVYQAYGYEKASYAVRDLPEQIISDIQLKLDHFFYQKNVTMVLYESQAMGAQFTHYVKGIDHAGLKGDASVPHKYEIAQNLNRLYRRYGKPVTVLYYGDLDKKGLEIPESAMDDIYTWLDEGVEVKFERIGITVEQIRELGLEKPGRTTYEWEVLSDEQAKGLIIGTMGQYVDLELIERFEDASERLTMAHRHRVRELLNNGYGKT